MAECLRLLFFSILNKIAHHLTAVGLMSLALRSCETSQVLLAGG